MSRTTTTTARGPGTGLGAGHYHHKGGARGGNRPRPPPLCRGRSPQPQEATLPVPNTRRPSPRLCKQRQVCPGVRSPDLGGAGPRFESRVRQKQPLGSQIPISDLRTPLGIVFDGGDDGNIVSDPFDLLHPQNHPYLYVCSTHRGTHAPVSSAHTLCKIHTWGSCGNHSTQLPKDTCLRCV